MMLKKKKITNEKQIGFGAVFSYALIVLNTLYGLVITPYILNHLGNGEFGVYKTIGSFSSTLMVLDLGIGSTVMRYVAKYQAEKNKNDIGNFSAIGLIESSIMSIATLVVGIVMFFSLEPMYSMSFTPGELDSAKSVFVLLLINMVLVLFENVLNGVITGCNEFIFANGYKLALLFLRSVSIIIILQFFKSAIALAVISVAASILSIVGQLWYIRQKMCIVIKLSKWDNALFRESLGYTALMLLQTIAHQANGNIDNVVIGALIGTSAVTVYSFGIQLFSMFETLATSVSGLMLPSVSSKLAEGISDEEMQNFVTRVGRIQLAILAPATIGFITVGKEFLLLWLGSGFEDVYYLTLILIIPVILPLIQNVCLSVLRAKNKMGFRTITLFSTALLNLVITVVGTYLFGYFASAIGTSIATIIGWLLMNVYYKRYIGFKPLRFYNNVSKRIILCSLLPGLAVVAMRQFIRSGSWIAFLAKVAIYIIIYALLIFKFGFSNEEKDFFKRVI